MNEADEYQELEFKHLPGGVGFSGHSENDLLIAHKKIINELKERKKRACG